MITREVIDQVEHTIEYKEVTRPDARKLEAEGWSMEEIIRQAGPIVLR